jgi:hypothetical protein
VFAGAGSFNSGIKRQQIGLVGNIVHNANFGSNLLHGFNSAGNRASAFAGFACCLDGFAIGNFGVVTVL